jgi:uncharacterized membrane protein YedE/YeeE
MDEETPVSSYWPWWAGAIALALVIVNFTLTTDRSFGVSSAWDRVLHWRRERELDRRRDEDVEESVLVEALAAATPSQLGVTGLPPRPHGSAVRSTTRPPPAPRPAPLVTQVALLVSIFAGGLVAALYSGRFETRLDMGTTFGEVVTQNPVVMVGTLFLGGVLVGFGTRLAGGCSSGHGLHGCGRLYPASILATAVFFGTAVAVSFLLWKVI